MNSRDNLAGHPRRALRAFAGITPEAGLIRKALLLGSLYLCQALPMGFIFGGMPIIMRSEHVPLQQIGLLFVLHFPWAMKIFYAARVDRHYLPTLGRRKTWIVPLVWLSAILFFTISFLDMGRHYPVIFAVLLIYNLAMATSDIAVDGYATDILAPGEMRWGATLQACGRFAGMILGGGLFLALYGVLGWPQICRLLALAQFLLSLPALTIREPSAPHVPHAMPGDRPGVLGFLKQPRARWAIPALLLPTAFFFCGFQMRMPLMADLGLIPKEAGTILMHVGYPVGFAATVLSGWLLKRVGALPFLRFFCLGAIGLTAATICHAGRGTISPTHAAILLACDNALLGAINVWAYTLIMRLSAGRQSGTGVAALGSIFMLPPLILAPPAGAVGDRVGFFTLYSGLLALMLLCWAMTEGVLAEAKRRGSSPLGVTK